jgi:hypothetical protein
MERHISPIVFILLIFIQSKNNVQLLYTMQEEFTINRIVPLMLKVSDIQQYDVNNRIFPYTYTVSNNVGTISKCITDVTWNINMKELLGDLYDKYDEFNLEVVQIATTPYTGSGPYDSHRPFLSYINTAYKNLNVFISGLNWVRSSFNQKTGNENATVHLGNIREINNGSDNEDPSWYVFNNVTYLYIAQTGYMNYNLCFKKEPNVQINIRLGGLNTGLDYTPSSIFDGNLTSIMQHFIIKFNIIPFK